jgi:serine/threonine-protein kinase RsbW
MIVEDHGAGVTAAEIPHATVSGPVEGGMGIAIMRTVVDELDVSGGSDGRGTVVRMTKRLR